MLNVSQEAVLRAAANRIVPADEYPSAGQVGAVIYVQRLLDRDLPHRWTELTEGLDRLDLAARVANQTDFAELSSDRQDAVLVQQENSPHADDRAFFGWLVEMVLESYYADPANGGNRGAVSWAMIGYDPRIPGYEPTDIAQDGQ
ncbi:MAG: hypothetical protein JWM57_474 [Phycisphaerales bacterium]|nr:hypothetical protein [Phycisphaerales bacterium]